MQTIIIWTLFSNSLNRLLIYNVAKPHAFMYYSYYIILNETTIPLNEIFGYFPIMCRLRNWGKPDNF